MSADSYGREWRGCYRVWVSSFFPFRPLLFLNRVLEPLPSPTRLATQSIVLSRRLLQVCQVS